MFEIQVVNGATSQWELWRIPNYGDAVFESESMARSVAKAAYESREIDGYRIMPVVTIEVAS
jgi:hypothetical protein